MCVCVKCARLKKSQKHVPIVQISWSVSGFPVDVDPIPTTAVFTIHDVKCMLEGGVFALRLFECYGSEVAVSP